MIIKGILFDMDGVLLETEEFHYLAWKKAFESKNINLSQSDYTRYCQAQGRRNAINNMVKAPTDEDYRLISDIKATAYKEAIDTHKVHLFDDAKLLLAFLENQQHIQLAIASSSVVADYVIKKTYVSWQFSHFITGAMINRNKPYPDIFNLAAKEINIPKKHLIVIEDSIAGVIAGRLAGINVFALNRNNSLDNLHSAPIELLIDELNLSLNEEELINLKQSSTISIDNLSEVIAYL